MTNKCFCGPPLLFLSFCNALLYLGKCTNELFISAELVCISVSAASLSVAEEKKTYIRGTFLSQLYDIRWYKSVLQEEKSYVFVSNVCLSCSYMVSTNTKCASVVLFVSSALKLNRSRWKGLCWRIHVMKYFSSDHSTIIFLKKTTPGL